MNIIYAANNNIDLLDYLSRASIVTFLIIIVYGGYKRWWVFGWVYREKIEELTATKVEYTINFNAIRDEKNAWRETALKGASIATQAFEEAKNRQSLQ